MLNYINKHTELIMFSYTILGDYMSDSYLTYTIKNGDTLYEIANNFNSSINRILGSNPNINLKNLQVGQKIIVPFSNVVSADTYYSYNILMRYIADLTIIYPFLYSGSIGKSVMDKSIPYLKIGNGEKEVFYSATIHANELITTTLLMKFVENLCLAYVNNSTIYGYLASEILEKTTIYIVPMCNPDGVDLVVGAIDKNSSFYKKALEISENYPDIPFPDGWKANINGVDLNLQFPAGWEKAKKIKHAQGYISPAPRDFVGYGPLTEPEALALYNFTLYHNFRLILAYHTQGKVIYWQFKNYATEEAKNIGKTFAIVSGYSLEETPYNSSFAGYKDWFLQTYGNPRIYNRSRFWRKPASYISNKYYLQ